MKVGIIGAAGRMGRILIEATLANPDTTLAAAVDVPGSSLIGADAGELVVLFLAERSLAMTDEIDDGH